MRASHAKRIKTMDSSKNKEEEEADRLFNCLPWDDLLPQILTFVGDGHYRFVGAVNHSFHDAYVTLFPSKKTGLNVSSKALAELCMKDFAEMWDAFYNSTESLSEGEKEDYFSELDGTGMAMSVLHTAAMYNFEVLQHLHSLPFDSKFSEEVWSSYLISSHAAEAGHLPVVQWLREQNIPSDRETCNAAARAGHLEILQWCHTHGFEWDESTFVAAVEGGHWPEIKYLYRNDCPWNSTACASAAGKGDLELLQWLVFKGCPWCPRTPSSAAFNGHLDVLEWAIYNDCPVDYETCNSAFHREHWGILNWALQHDLPADPEFFATVYIPVIGVSDDDVEEESEANDSDDEDLYVCPCCQAVVSLEEMHVHLQNSSC